MYWSTPTIDMQIYQIVSTVDHNYGSCGQKGLFQGILQPDNTFMYLIIIIRNIASELLECAESLQIKVLSTVCSLYGKCSYTSAVKPDHNVYTYSI